jgi:uncharacterized membrane-anchored protein YhcB (DUF1043 family)
MVELNETGALWIIGALGVLLGIGLGSVVTYTLTRRENRNENLQAELDQLVERFAEYREQVSQHFMHTSDLVQEMTRSYRAVYEHLATGAYHLCAEQTDAPSLEHSSADALPTDRDSSANEPEYDELAELSSIRNDIDSLLNDSPRFSKVDVSIEEDELKSIKH